jgi:hypothetical protein
MACLIRYNISHPDEEPEIRWRYFSARNLGGNPGGQTSAAIPSMRQYDTDGFIAVVIPFFSEIYLEEQHDLVDWVVDYRLHYVNATNGKTPRYYCVRLSHNGRDMHQVRARRLHDQAWPSVATHSMHPSL